MQQQQQRQRSSKFNRCRPKGGQRPAVVVKDDDESDDVITNLTVSSRAIKRTKKKNVKRTTICILEESDCCKDNRPKWHVIISIITMVLYYNSLSAELVYDDSRAIVNNPDVVGQHQHNDNVIGRLGTFGDWLNLWFNDYWGTNLLHSGSHKSYRPLVVITFKLNHLIHGLAPFGYHLVNLLLHLIVCNLILIVSSKLLSDNQSTMLNNNSNNTKCLSGGINNHQSARIINANYYNRKCIITALLFVCHPIHVEAVTSVVGRAELLGSIMFMISFIYYIHYCESRSNSSLLIQADTAILDTSTSGKASEYSSLVKSLLFASMALLCKENTITVFAINATYDILHHLRWYHKKQATMNTHHKRDTRTTRRISTSENSAKIQWFGLVSLIAVCSILVVIRVMLMNGLPTFSSADNPIASNKSICTRLLTFSYLPYFNLLLLIYPKTLSFDWSTDYMTPIEKLSDIRLVEIILFYSLVTGIIISISKYYYNMLIITCCYDDDDTIKIKNYSIEGAATQQQQYHINTSNRRIRKKRRPLKQIQQSAANISIKINNNNKYTCSDDEIPSSEANNECLAIFDQYHPVPLTTSSHIELSPKSSSPCSLSSFLSSSSSSGSSSDHELEYMSSSSSSVENNQDNNNQSMMVNNKLASFSESYSIAPSIDDNNNNDDDDDDDNNNNNTPTTKSTRYNLISVSGTTTDSGHLSDNNNNNNEDSGLDIVLEEEEENLVDNVGPLWRSNTSETTANRQAISSSKYIPISKQKIKLKRRSNVKQQQQQQQHHHQKQQQQQQQDKKRLQKQIEEQQMKHQSIQQQRHRQQQTPSSNMSLYEQEERNKKIEQLTLAITIMMMTFLPSSNLLFYVGFVVAERTLYLPSVGFCMLIALAIEWAREKLDDEDKTCEKKVMIQNDSYFHFFINMTSLLPRRLNIKPYISQTNHSKQRLTGQIYMFAFLVPVLLLASYRTIARNNDWINEQALYTSNLEVSLSKASNNLAIVYTNMARFDEAEFHYRRALKYRPNMADAHYNLGALLQQQGKLNESISEYTQAIKYRPQLALAYLNLGTLYESQYKLNESERMYLLCSQLSDYKLKDPIAHRLAQISCLVNLAKQYLEHNNQPLKAIEILQHRCSSFDKYLDLNNYHLKPRLDLLANIHTILGEAYRSLKQDSDSKRHFNLALTYRGRDARALISLSNDLMKQGKIAEAKSIYVNALGAFHHYDSISQANLRHHYADALYKDLQLNKNQRTNKIPSDKIMNNNNLFQPIIYQLTIACELQPENYNIISFLADIYRQSNNYSKAEELYEKSVTIAKSQLNQSQSQSQSQSQPQSPPITWVSMKQQQSIRRLATSHLNYGAILHLNGKLLKARDEYEKALSIDKSYTLAKYNLDNINGLLLRKANL